MVGSMGHASSIALGIALQKPEKQVVIEAFISYNHYHTRNGIFVLYLIPVLRAKI